MMTTSKISWTNKNEATMPEYNVINIDDEKNNPWDSENPPQETSPAVPESQGRIEKSTSVTVGWICFGIAIIFNIGLVLAQWHRRPNYDDAKWYPVCMFFFCLVNGICMFVPAWLTVKTELLTFSSDSSLEYSSFGYALALIFGALFIMIALIYVLPFKVWPAIKQGKETEAETVEIKNYTVLEPIFKNDAETVTSDKIMLSKEDDEIVRLGEIQSLKQDAGILLLENFKELKVWVHRRYLTSNKAANTRETQEKEGQRSPTEEEKNIKEGVFKVYKHENEQLFIYQGSLNREEVQFVYAFKYSDLKKKKYMLIQV